MALVKEFKEFVMKGNVVDMAVGIIIGLAFGKIVTSVVNDIIMPPIGYALGGVDFSNLMLVLRDATPTAPAVAIRYGVFINTVIDFLIVAAAVFMLVKLINRLRAQPVPAPTVKKCPECGMDIPINARRCGHCTTQLEAKAF